MKNLISEIRHHTATPWCLLVTGALACAPSQAQNSHGMVSPEIIALETPRAFEAPGTASLPGLSQVIRIGRTVMTSAVLPTDSVGALVGSGNLEAQTNQILRNLERVLGSAGARPTEVVRLTVYVVGLTAEKVTEVQTVAGPFFGPRPPTGVFVGVSSLALDGALISVDVIAETAGLLPDRNAAQPSHRPPLPREL